jgi:hypothetical protein
MLGIVTTFAGTGESSGYTDGTVSTAKFSYPIGAAFDSNGVLYITDNGNSAVRVIVTAGAWSI